MDEEILRKENGAPDAPEGTSPSDAGTEAENIQGNIQENIQLSSDAVPTEQEKAEAGLLPGTETRIEDRQGLEPSVPETSGNDVAADDAEGNFGAPEKSLGNPPADMPSAEKLFTQSQVNELTGKARMEGRSAGRRETAEYLYGRYGVDSEGAMDDLVGNAQRYDTAMEEFGTERKAWEAERSEYARRIAELGESVALLQSGIDPSRYDDAKAIIRAKGLEVTPETIGQELGTHPEWMGNRGKEDQNPNFRPDPAAESKPLPKSPESAIRVLGNEGGSQDGQGMSEEEYALSKLYKV